MGDLKTNWDNPALADHESSGQGIITSGSDPNAEGGDGPGALQYVWPDEKKIAAVPGDVESPNSVSGLPALPNRFEPSESTVEPPTLQDRMPGTIDKP